MTTRYIKPGDALDYTAPAAVNVNDVVPVGSFVGVAATNIAANATGTLLVNGVFNLPKIAGTAMPVGTKLTWSIADKAFIVGAGVAGDVANCAVVVEQGALAGDATVSAYIANGLGSAVVA